MFNREVRVRVRVRVRSMHSVRYDTNMIRIWYEYGMNTTTIYSNNTTLLYSSTLPTCWIFFACNTVVRDLFDVLYRPLEIHRRVGDKIRGLCVIPIIFAVVEYR